MIESITSKSIPNKATAKAVHAGLIAGRASPYEFGVFYRTMLTQGLWRSQTSIAKDLGLSRAHVTKTLSIARIPPTVVALLGGPARISFRVGPLILSAIDTVGEDGVAARARTAKDLGYVSIEDVLEYVLTNRLPEPREKSAVRIRLTRDRKALRIETPIAIRLLRDVGKLEDYMALAFAMFEASMQAEAKEMLRRRNAQRSRTRNGERLAITPNKAQM
ncbi:hypothetical protein VSR34_33305 [Paraburkholderia sp. JHI2823]|uniref:hypothetical protein n=1 Tax=Paraburkholderia sp. JHI2823 TaxID=3112960 RepID=UPI003176A86B